MSKKTRYKNIVVLIADGTSDKTEDILSIHGLQPLNGSVPVTVKYQDDKVVGVAILRKDGPRVLADMTLYGDLIWSNSEPSICGRVLERDLSDRTKVLKFSITSIGLFPVGSNADKRIQKLGAPT